MSKSKAARVTLIAILLAVTSQAEVVGLAGTVYEVVDGDVSIQVCARRPPQVNDLVEIAFEDEDGVPTNAGVWRILGVETCFLKVVGVCNTEAPFLGQRVVVFLNTPASAPVPDERPVVEREPRRPVRSNKITTAIDMLGSPNPFDMQRAAKILYRHYRYDPVVQKTAEAFLLDYYADGLTDRYRVDALAWLCKILGVSGNRDYIATLREVAENTLNYKLSLYATKNLRLLEWIERY